MRQRFLECEKIATLLTTTTLELSSTAVWPKFMHARGLRQGDPLSPLLFVIAMGVLTAMMVKAQHLVAISAMPGCTPLHPSSICVDDVVLFVRPTISDMSFVRETLNIFGTTSGLQVNFAKSSM